MRGNRGKRESCTSGEKKALGTSLPDIEHSRINPDLENDGRIENDGCPGAGPELLEEQDRWWEEPVRDYPK